MSKTNIFRLSVLWTFIGSIIVACDPSTDDDITLGPLPDSPEFSITYLTGDSNRVAVTDLSQGNFDRLWVFQGGDPRTSKAVTDTIQYVKKGVYEIILHVASASGNGTATSMKSVEIFKDTEIPCDGKISLLTGDCGPDPKCWTFTTGSGAVIVGPTYGSSEWYTSPAGGLNPAQYDDNFCFVFEGQVFDYQNNGTTVSPWHGYSAIPYDPPEANWIFREGTGMNGADQIILTEGAFMGVWDSGNILDVIVLSESELVVRTRLTDQQGNPQNEGWFELHFIAR